MVVGLATSLRLAYASGRTWTLRGSNPRDGPMVHQHIQVGDVTLGEEHGASTMKNHQCICSRRLPSLLLLRRSKERRNFFYHRVTSLGEVKRLQLLGTENAVCEPYSAYGEQNAEAP